MKEEIYNYIVDNIKAKIHQNTAPFSISMYELCNGLNCEINTIKSLLNELFKENRIKVYEGMHSKYIYLESIKIIP